MTKLKNSIKTYRRLLKSTQKYWVSFLMGMVGTILLSLSDATLTWSVKPLLNEGLVHRNQVFIHALPILLLMIFGFRGVAGFMSNYFISRVARNVVMDFRRQVFNKLLHLPSTYFDHHSSGRIISTIIYNVEQLAQASSDTLVTCLQELSLAIGLIAVMFIVSWQLALLFLIVSPFIAWVVKKNSSRMRRLSSNVQKSVGDVTHVSDECIQGYKVIRIFGGQKYEYEKFYKATKKNQQRELKMVVTNSIGTAIVQFIISIPISMAILFAVMMSSINVSAGSFGAVVVAMVMILKPVRRLTTVNNQIQKGVAGAESVFAILDEESEKDTGQFTKDRVSGYIEFDNVKFSYKRSHEQILGGINLQVKPGQTVAIVGSSGAGKTTLINLLPRFYDVTSGAIKIDGVNINEYSLMSLRNQFSLVSQNPVLFNDTIANNIAYGIRDKLSDNQIIQAAEAAYAMEFIRHLPEELNAMIGENGVMLSGGQRQRLAIARALLKNAPILILDEATSALDSHSERRIQQALDNLMQQRTTLVIAHRLSTIENADWIIVMEKGLIIEQGTHQDLLNRDGAYASLHQMQFRDVPIA